MAVSAWIRQRAQRGADPSSSPTKPPDLSATHARLFQAVDVVASAASGKAGDFPGGQAMAELIIRKAKDVLAKKSEDELKQYVALLGKLADAVRTGEGFDELMRNGPTS